MMDREKAIEKLARYAHSIMNDDNLVVAYHNWDCETTGRQNEFIKKARHILKIIEQAGYRLPAEPPQDKVETIGDYLEILMDSWDNYILGKSRDVIGLDEATEKLLALIQPAPVQTDKSKVEKGEFEAVPDEPDQPELKVLEEINTLEAEFDSDEVLGFVIRGKLKVWQAQLADSPEVKE